MPFCGVGILGLGPDIPSTPPDGVRDLCIVTRDTRFAKKFLKNPMSSLRHIQK